MFKSKCIFGLYIISTFVLGFFMQPAVAQGLTPAKKDAITSINAGKANYEEIAKYIWENPELSLEEFKSSAKLQEYLKENGFRVETGVSGMPTAFIATWGSGNPVIGFLAQFDALPGLSQEAGIAIERPIIPGRPGHGCGHNILGAASATAAIGTKCAMEKNGIKGTIKVFGSPAEETLVGSVFMARDGVFNGTDIMIFWHPGGENTTSNRSSLALTSVKFQFKGKSAHSTGAPEAGRSALDSVELMNTAVNYMKEHIVPEARINYVILKGGDVPNVVPADTEVWYFLRAPRRSQLDHIFNWMQDIAKGAALMTQTKMTYKILSASWEFLPNKVLTKVGDGNAIAIGAPPLTAEDQKFGEKIIQSLGREVKGKAFDTKVTPPYLNRTFPNVFVMRGSTDAGNVSWIVPTVFFQVATYVKGTPLHSWQAVSQSCSAAAIKAGLTASKWMAATALDCLTNLEIISEARKEHNQYLAETKYYDPIPVDLKVPTYKDLYRIEPETVTGTKK